MIKWILEIGVCWMITALGATAQTGSCGKLVGTWRLISAMQDGQPRENVGKTQTQIKHVTDTQFTWVIYKNDTKEVVAALGGPCAISGDTYTETPQYSFGIADAFKELRDKQQRFTWRLDADRWNLKGQLSQGTKLDEVWERVK